MTGKDQGALCLIEFGPAGAQGTVERVSQQADSGLPRNALYGLHRTVFPATGCFSRGVAGTGPATYVGPDCTQSTGKSCADVPVTNYPDPGRGGRSENRRRSVWAYRSRRWRAWPCSRPLARSRPGRKMRRAKGNPRPSCDGTRAPRRRPRERRQLVEQSPELVAQSLCIGIVGLLTGRGHHPRSRAVHAHSLQPRRDRDDTPRTTSTSS